MLIDPAKIRWIGFSHFEADEYGALREWQTLAPEDTAIFSLAAKLIDVDDVLAARPAKATNDGELISTGKYRFRFILTPHVPHNWDAELLYEEVNETPLCSRLFYQTGDVDDRTSADIVGRFRQSLFADRQGPRVNPLPYTSHTERTLDRRIQQDLILKSTRKEMIFSSFPPPNRVGQTGSLPYPRALIFILSERRNAT